MNFKVQNVQLVANRAIDILERMLSSILGNVSTELRNKR